MMVPPQIDSRSILKEVASRQEQRPAVRRELGPKKFLAAVAKL